MIVRKSSVDIGIIDDQSKIQFVSGGRNCDEWDEKKVYNATRDTKFPSVKNCLAFVLGGIGRGKVPFPFLRKRRVLLLRIFND